MYGIYNQIVSSDYDFYGKLKLFPAVSLLYANYKRNNRYSFCSIASSSSCKSLDSFDFRLDDFKIS